MASPGALGEDSQISDFSVTGKDAGQLQDGESVLVHKL